MFLFKEYQQLLRSNVFHLEKNNPISHELILHRFKVNWLWKLLNKTRETAWRCSRLHELASIAALILTVFLSSNWNCFYTMSLRQKSGIQRVWQMKRFNSLTALCHSILKQWVLTQKPRSTTCSYGTENSKILFSLVMHRFCFECLESLNCIIWFFMERT